MKIYLSYKFELLFNNPQIILACQTAGSCRFIWNEWLALKKEKWENNKEKISRYELDKILTELKKEKNWLCMPPSQTLQQVNKDLDQAFKNFYNGFGYPNFKKKGINDSFRIPQGIKLEKKISKKIGQVRLPKFGIVKFIATRQTEGKIKNVTISKEGDKWNISFDCEIEKEIPQKKEGFQSGIDRGIVTFAKLSNNTDIPAISVLKKNLTKIKKLQRKLKKKTKFSSNWKKAKKSSSTCKK